MKFINYLESISGIGIYPMTSLMIFFFFFIGLFVRIYFMDNQLISHMGNLPLDDAETDETQSFKN